MCLFISSTAMALATFAGYIRKENITMLFSEHPLLLRHQELITLTSVAVHPKECSYIAQLLSTLCLGLLDIFGSLACIKVIQNNENVWWAVYNYYFYIMVNIGWSFKIFIS